MLYQFKLKVEKIVLKPIWILLRKKTGGLKTFKIIDQVKNNLRLESTMLLH